MKLHDIGEFGLINRFAPRFSKNLPKGVLGIGDDCAIMPSTESKSLLVTTDLLMENIHFLKNKISPQDLGHKALAVNLSDIAAKGGAPKYAFLSLGLPSNTDISWVDAFFDGIHALATAEGVLLLGGDTTSSPSAVVINITLIGEIESALIKRRSHAQVGDLIFCTGNLGDSAAGLRVILDNLPEDETTQSLLIAHNRPLPQLKEGQWLSQQSTVHAVMDVSDGIDSDLRRIMEQSACGAHVELAGLPLSTHFKKICKTYEWNTFELAATGGEDYCLLATSAPDGFSQLNEGFRKTFGRPLFPIGEITSDPSQLFYTLEGSPIDLSKKGFEHFHQR